MKKYKALPAAAAVAVLLLLAVIVTGVFAEASYRELKKGDSGPDVTALKERLFDLGYITSRNFGDDYNKNTVERIRQLQKKNGLRQTGIATPELQELIFSDNCIGKDGKKRAAADSSNGKAPARFLMPEPAGKTKIPLDEEGFYDAEKPYVYADRKAGVWSYVSRDIHVEVRQRVDKSVPHQWLEAAIRYREPAFFGAMVNEAPPEKMTKSGTFLSKPTTIVRDHKAVFAFSDDFFGYRMLNKQTTGIVIRNGRVWSEKTKKGDSRVWPPLDLIALFDDGHMKTYESDSHTAQEYLDMGVVSTFAFGPILVENGTVCPDLKKWRTTDRAPRMAMGITADGTILAVDVLGRRKDAVGVTITWLADKLIELGAVEAVNLDGGNTTCMIFMDDVINRPAGVKEKDLRTVNGMIGIREGKE
ncbi:phosphodiester glycosidase family protein [Clostridiales bacterium]|nr:phosphodiester glycosidase family protein [Clostridiales bacterium]